MFRLYRQTSVFEVYVRRYSLTISGNFDDESPSQSLNCDLLALSQKTICLPWTFTEDYAVASDFRRTLCGFFVVSQKTTSTFPENYVVCFDFRRRLHGFLGLSQKTDSSIYL